MTIQKFISILIFAFASLRANANTHVSDTLVVIFDKQQFVQGDSIEMEVYTETFKANRPAQTLHLWIDNVKTGQRWKFRYPFLKGRYKFSIKIGSNMPDGTYAFNFLLQSRFLMVKGKLKNATDEDRSVNYIAVSKTKGSIIDGAELAPDNTFSINNLFYTDSVYFSFSPTRKTKLNPYKVAIETPIDSAFVPEALTTELISIGNGEASVPEAKAPGYVFNASSKKDKELLQEVILNSKVKTRRQQFENENVSALFSSDGARTFDFYESDELKNYTDIYSYITANVAGITSHNDEETGKTNLYWRNEKVNIYVDEFLDTDFSPIALSMQEIEMIKIFSPGSRLGLDGFGGSIAIYTRRRSSRPGNSMSNYCFYVKGYTEKTALWQ